MEEELKDLFKCKNCQTNSEEMIEISKKTLHEVYCFRNLYKCKCGEIVDRKEEEFHRNEYHKKVQCQYCKESLEQWQLESHKCEKRPQRCPYCENTFPADIYKDHLEQCGSKTELCLNCKQYITKREWAEHERKGCDIIVTGDSFPEVPGIVFCNNFNKLRRERWDKRQLGRNQKFRRKK